PVKQVAGLWSGGRHALVGRIRSPMLKPTPWAPPVPHRQRDQNGGQQELCQDLQREQIEGLLADLSLAHYRPPADSRLRAPAFIDIAGRSLSGNSRRPERTIGPARTIPAVVDILQARERVCSHFRALPKAPEPTIIATSWGIERNFE